TTPITTLSPEAVGMSEEALLVESYLADIAMMPEDQQEPEFRLVTDFMDEAMGDEERQILLKRLETRELLGRLAAPYRSWLQEKYGEHNNFQEEVEHLLSGKSPFLIMPSKEWEGVAEEDFEKELTSRLSEAVDLRLVGEPMTFPRPEWEGESSIVHLDRYPRPESRYTLSASRLESGQVVGIFGIATIRDVNAVPHPSHQTTEKVSQFEDLKIAVNNSPELKRLYDDIKSGRPPKYKEMNVITDPHVPDSKTHFYCVLLDPGDVVVWPQGGEASKRPAWHGFRSVGDQARKSTSYHFIAKT
ncbi:MAG TPA: hypothetical protein VGF75_02225, partial [Candidatus Saccharimonadales bacterium]